MKTRTMQVADLKHDPKNARKHPAKNLEMIEQSIRDVGVSRSGVIDEDGVILAGNGTAEVLEAAGISKVRVVETDGDEWVVVQRKGLTEEQKRKLSIGDNKSAELAVWDGELLQAQDIDLAPYFPTEELKSYGVDGDSKDGGSGRDAEPQIDKAAELQKEYGTQSGQVWQLGEHRVVCGDCTDETAVQSVIGKDSICLLFTDPPYGVSIGAKNRRLNSFVGGVGRRAASGIQSDSLSASDLKAMLLKCLRIAQSYLSDQCSVFVCSPQGGELGMMMMMMMMKEAGLEVRHVLNWVKEQATFSMGRLDYAYQHEPILFTWTKSHKRNKAGPFQTTIWPVNKPRHSAEHPTMKPVDLPENAILNHTDLGDFVYDPFLGSGTSLVACENLSRKCRGIEIDPGYVAVTLKRWSDLTGQEPKLL